MPRSPWHESRGGEPRSDAHLGRAAIVALALLLGVGAAARAQTATAQPAASPEASESATAPPAPQSFDDPFEAYAAGRYDLALQGFVDRQVERPEDPALALNLGSAHYKMKNYAEADRAFATAALSTDAPLRQEALYNLGNSAYRQGRLDEAVELFKAALEIDPDDEDAKFNLEFVRNEIRRRHEEAKKRQQEGQQRSGWAAGGAGTAAGGGRLSRLRAQARGSASRASRRAGPGPGRSPRSGGADRGESHRPPQPRHRRRRSPRRGGGFQPQRPGRSRRNRPESDR